MPTVQSTYNSTQPKAYVGLVANMETQNSITRTVEETNGIGFGIPVVRGTQDKSILLPLSLAYTAAAVARAGNTGNGTITASPVVSAGARSGVYTVIADDTTGTDNGTFRVEGPDGVYVGVARVAVPFTGGGLTFTIADGATDFVDGDGFNITVTATAGGGNYQGVTIADPTLQRKVTVNVVSAVDTFQKGDNVALLEIGVIWVRFGATIAAGQTAYFNTTTLRWTNVATDFAIPRARFEDSGVDGDIGRVRILGL